MDNKDKDILKKRIIQMHCDVYTTVDSEIKLERLKKFDKNFKHFRDVNLETQKDSVSLNDLVQELYTKNLIDSRTLTLLAVFHFLLAAEGAICNFLNYVCLLLIQNGHDLFSITSKKYVKNEYNEIMKTEFSTKMKFLNHHGFKKLTKEYDSSLRNSIAHHNYIIDEKGNLFSKGNKIDLISKIESLTEMIYFSSEVFKEMDKKISSINEGLKTKIKKT